MTAGKIGWSTQVLLGLRNRWEANPCFAKSCSIEHYGVMSPESLTILIIESNLHTLELINCFRRDCEEAENTRLAPLWMSQSLQM